MPKYLAKIPRINTKRGVQYVYASGGKRTHLGVGSGRGGSKVMLIGNSRGKSASFRTYVETQRRRPMPYQSGGGSLRGLQVGTRNAQYGVNRPITQASRGRLARLTRGFRNSGAERSKFGLYV